VNDPGGLPEFGGRVLQVDGIRDRRGIAVVRPTPGAPSGALRRAGSREASDVGDELADALVAELAPGHHQRVPADRCPSVPDHQEEVLVSARATVAVRVELELPDAEVARHRHDREPGDLDRLALHCKLLGPGNTFCALAPGAVEPLQSALKYFEEDFQQHVREKRCPWR